MGTGRNELFGKMEEESGCNNIRKGKHDTGQERKARKRPGESGKVGVSVRTEKLGKLGKTGEGSREKNSDR